MLLVAGFFVLLVHAGCGTADSPRAPAADQPLEVANDGTPADDADGDTAAEPSDPSLPAVTLQLNWFPEAEHGGYYAAIAQGYYREAGLNVKILPGGADTPVIQQVARRAVTFGVVNADNILFGRAREAPIVALMDPLQISPRCLIVHESSGIRDFDDLKDMTIAMSRSDAFSVFLQHKLPLRGVKIVPYSGSVALFLRHKDFAQQGYVFSEPFVIRKEGGDPKVLMVSELGFNPYTSVLFTHDAQSREQKEIVGKMVAASVRGWAHYVKSPEAANRLIHRENHEMDLDILDFGAAALVPLVLDDAAEQQGVGTMSRARWQTLADQLVESGQLKPGQVHVDEAFTTSFLHPDQ